MKKKDPLERQRMKDVGEYRRRQRRLQHHHQQQEEQEEEEEGEFQCYYHLKCIAS